MDASGVEIATFWVGTQVFGLEEDLTTRYPGFDLSGWDRFNTISAISGNAIEGYNLTGWGTRTDGREEAFAITGFAAPEPNAAILTAAGLVSLLSMRRRPKNRQVGA
jgi:hypothetical protein